jgi:phosphoserine aminotransferase
MARALNFNAGPAALPLPALERAREELLDFKGSGMSIMEHSHRGKEYDAVHAEAIALLRDLAGIPDDYDVMLVQGGASQQFATVPMNFLPAGKSADYLLTGVWAEKAFEEAQLSASGACGKPRIAATTAVDGPGGEKKYTRIPKQAELQLDPAAAYVHMTTNNTIFGTQWHWWPEVGNVPLIADMSSDILWKPIDVKKFAMIYAGAQKNIGPSGLTLVIARKSLIEQGRKDIPKIFRYATHAKNNSLYNTPPTFAIYLMRNVLAWMKGVGGVAEMGRRNQEKADLLYGTLDAHPGVFGAPVAKDSRSTMNVVFTLKDAAAEEKFLAGAKDRKMVGLKGHRSVGGIRVSQYNAVPVEWVKTLCDYMTEFAKTHG